MKDESIRGAELVGGITVLTFGIAAVFWPGLTLLTLLYLFATYALVSGIINLMSGIFQVERDASSAILKVVLGVLQLGVGVYLLRHPHVTFATFILLIGFTLIFRGVFDIVAAFMADLGATKQTMSAIAGLLSLVVGIVVLFQPEKSGVAFVWLLGIYALIAGPIAIAMSVEDRKAAK